MTNIIINGANGKMGLVTQAAIKNEKTFNLVATLNRNDNLEAAIKDTKANIVIDFTTPDSVYQNTKIIIKNKAHPVIGTTGLTLEQINELKKQCEAEKLGGIIAPNFSLGAILMMKYSADAATYFHNVEIIEKHHEKKIDSPSGTAKKTAELMSENKKQKNDSADLTRGKNIKNIPIHSLRLPGIFAEQEVIFGGQGETLTIQHRAMTRESMMPGVILACKKVVALKTLIYGLENLV